MKKLVNRKQVFYTCKRASGFVGGNQYTWGEVKEELKKGNFELQDTDTLYIDFEEGWDEGDSARDDFWAIKVYRDIEETDEEFEKRKISWEKRMEESRKERYNQYLKLKKEFEN